MNYTELIERLYSYGRGPCAYWEAAATIETLVADLDIQAGSIEAVQAANQRLAAERDNLLERLAANQREELLLRAELDRYKKHGVTCQTYGHVVGACSECNTHDETIRKEAADDAAESVQHFAGKYFELLPLYDALRAELDAIEGEKKCTNGSGNTLQSQSSTESVDATPMHADTSVGRKVPDSPIQVGSYPDKQCQAPDEQLCRFYQVQTYPELVVVMERQILKLQARLPKLVEPVTPKVREG